MVVRVGWWALLLPAAIAAWSAARLHGVPRAAGYAMAGVVLVVGIAACSTDTPTPVPAAVDTRAPMAAVPSASVAAPTAAPASISASPVMPTLVTHTQAHIASPAHRASTAAPKPRAASNPAPTSAGSTGAAGTYTNVDGNQVERPDANSAGATAICKDGTDSHSQHHAGTCSGHGGVAKWL